ncbi:TELO2-interacting protein 2 [Ixodes scapularis]
MDALRSMKNEKCLIKKLSLVQKVRASVNEVSGDLHELDRTVISEFAASLAFSGIPKDSVADEEREYTRSDFRGIAELATEGLLCARSLLERSPESLEDREVTTALALVCFAHVDAEQPWCSESSSKASKGFLEFLVSSAASSGRLALAVLKHIQPKLKKNTWKKNPCYRHVYKNALYQLGDSESSDALSLLLPPGLLLVDDYMTHNQRLGIQCVQHIISKATPTELQWHGHFDVIFDALKRLLYVKEPEVITELHSCLRRLLFGDSNEGLRPLHLKSEDCLRKGEEVYGELLTAAYAEQKFVLRTAYSSQLAAYIECLGINVVKHMSKTLDVVLEYVETYDTAEQASRRNGLLALAALIRCAWPRISRHFRRIAECLFRLAYDLKEHDKGDLRDEIAACLLLLEAACPEQFIQFTKDLTSLQDRGIPGVALLLECVNARQRE